MCLNILKKLKVGTNRFYLLTSLKNVRFLDGPQSSGRSGEVSNLLWIDAHNPGAGRVGGNKVCSHHDHSGLLGLPHDRAIAFHADDAVNYREVRSDGDVDVKYRLLDSFPMEDVLRPTIKDTRHHPKEILHGERDPCPVMSLEFGHRDDPVDAFQCFGQY